MSRSIGQLRPPPAAELDPARPWWDPRLAAAKATHAKCHNTRRHRYPDDVYTDEPKEYDAAGQLLVVTRSQTCERCGTKCSIIVNVQTWSRVGSSAAYEWPDGYRLEGPPPTSEALLYDSFVRTSTLVDQLLTQPPAPAPARKTRPAKTTAKTTAKAAAHPVKAARPRRAPARV